MRKSSLFDAVALVLFTFQLVEVGSTNMEAYDFTPPCATNGQSEIH